MIRTSLSKWTVGSQSRSTLRLRGIPDQVVHFGGAQDRGIDPDVLLPVEASVREGDLDQVADRVADAGGDDVVLRAILLQHQSRPTPDISNCRTGSPPISAPVSRPISGRAEALRSRPSRSWTKPTCGPPSRTCAAIPRRLSTAEISASISKSLSRAHQCWSRRAPSKSKRRGKPSSLVPLAVASSERRPARAWRRRNGRSSESCIYMNRRPPRTRITKRILMRIQPRRPSLSTGPADSTPPHSGVRNPRRLLVHLQYDRRGSPGARQRHVPPLKIHVSASDAC